MTCTMLVPAAGHFVFAPCARRAVYRVVGTLTVVCRECVDKYMGHMPASVLRPLRGDRIQAADGGAP